MPKAASLAKPVNLRIRDDVRSLIDRAAESQGKSRSEFMIDASRRAAEEALLDRAFYRLGDADYAAFVEVLDNPPPAGPKLKKLMARTPVWAARRIAA